MSHTFFVLSFLLIRFYLEYRESESRFCFFSFQEIVFGTKNWVNLPLPFWFLSFLFCLYVCWGVLLLLVVSFFLSWLLNFTNYSQQRILWRLVDGSLWFWVALRRLWERPKENRREVEEWRRMNTRRRLQWKVTVWKVVLAGWRCYCCFSCCWTWSNSKLKFLLRISSKNFPYSTSHFFTV